METETESTVEDVYPSRVYDSPRVLERQDPVIHTKLDAAQGPLSQDELDQFDKDGFLFFENFFNPDEMRTFREELGALAESDEIKSSDGIAADPETGEIRSIFDVTQRCQLVFVLSRERRIVEMISQILGSDVYIHQSRVNFKPGFIGKERYWHSDFETWHVEDGMPRMRAVSCSILLTENSEFNGPLMLIPGSHKQFVSCVKSAANTDRHSLEGQRYGVPDNDSLQRLVDEGGIAAPRGRAGSLLVFDANIMHGSNSNITPYPRSNIFLVYNSTENALVKPFSGKEPRPEFLANRDCQPVSPITVESGYDILCSEERLSVTNA